MRGRRPIPTALRLIRGVRSHKRSNPHEPKPARLSESCPRELTNPLAREEWRRAISPAVTRGQVTVDDRALAIAHCELWATWRELLTEAARHPLIVTVGKHHSPATNPALVQANKTLLLLVKVDAELGFGPSSRTRIRVPPPSTDKDNFDEFC